MSGAPPAGSSATTRWPPDDGPHRRAGGLLRPAGHESGFVEMLAWAEREGLAVGVVGSGSNLLVADDGFRGLAIKLDGELAAIERDGDADPLRRRRPPSLGGGEGRRLGALRASSSGSTSRAP